MIGPVDDPGIIPNLLEEIFHTMEGNGKTNLSFKLEVSFLEIYNDSLRDLLNPTMSSSLKVREHPKSGPYVEKLTWLAARSVNDVRRILDMGYRSRTVAQTIMNDESSRSHAVFQAILTQVEVTSDETTESRHEKVSKISLVDLAGSERQSTDTLSASQAERLKEGCYINKALSALSNCIYALYMQSKIKDKMHIPYRDSSLTWCDAEHTWWSADRCRLLKESLGGNSKTAIIAAIAPSETCYEETLSTLKCGVGDLGGIADELVTRRGRRESRRTPS